MITRRDNFVRQKERLFRGSINRLRVVADFDRTLTTNFIHGRKSPSLLGALYEGNYLSKDYAAKAQALFDYYRPFEEDLSLNLAAKKALMEEWWRQHFALLIASGLKQEHIMQVADDRLSNLRVGVPEFLDILSQHQIPLFIFSATGLGSSGLKYFLTRRGLWTDNICLLANDFIWSATGEAIGFREPIIHSFNKDETVITDFGYNDQLKGRDNILLLGDSLGDANMENGSVNSALLKIGFLNDKIQELLPAYRQVYDVLILNDGDFSLPLEILREIINYAD